MLLLVRHGSAGEARVDHERALTEVGRAEVAALAQALERKDVRVDRILHSGLVRAGETAGILAGLSGSEPVAREGLRPGDDPDMFIAELSELEGSTMVVSHLPFLPELAGELLEEVSPLPQFRTATAVCLEPTDQTRDRGTWRFLWQLNGRDQILR